MRDFQSKLLTDLATTDVQERWDMFASRLEQGIDKFIPTREAGTRDGFPWINQEIRRLRRKRDKLYKRMKRSGRPNDTKKFLDYKHLIRKVTGRAYARYLGDVLGINTTTEQEENSPPKVTNPPPPPQPLHLYTEPRLMSSTEVKTYRKKERGFKIAVILRPVSQTGYEKVAQTHFVDFDFGFLEKGQRAHLVFVTEALTYMIIPAKTKIDRAWKNDIMLCVCI